jgi:hypothetical protein
MVKACPKCGEGMSGYKGRCKKCFASYMRVYAKQRWTDEPEVRIRQNAATRKWRNKQPDYLQNSYEYRRLLRLAFTERYRERAKIAYQKPYRKRQAVQYRLELRRTNLGARLHHRLSKRIRAAVRRGYKSATTVELLGCSIESFQIYLESKFEPGMSWENYGYGKDKWHIDHIMPCAIFDLVRPDHQRSCFHFSNLQPLWQLDNLIKSNKMPTY